MRPPRYHHAAVDSRGILELILTALNDIVEFELAVILKLSDEHVLRVQQFDQQGERNRELRLTGDRFRVFDHHITQRLSCQRAIGYH